MKATKKVCVTRCGKCHLERFGFSPVTGNCPRCASPVSVNRWINNPAPETIAQAAEEQAGPNGARIRILASAAEYDRRGDVVLRDQAVRQSEATAEQAAGFFRRVTAGEKPVLAAVHAVAR